MAKYIGPFDVVVIKGKEVHPNEAVDLTAEERRVLHRTEGYHFDDVAPASATPIFHGENHVSAQAANMTAAAQHVQELSKSGKTAEAAPAEDDEVHPPNEQGVSEPLQKRR